MNLVSTRPVPAEELAELKSSYLRDHVCVIKKILPMEIAKAINDLMFAKNVIQLSFMHSDNIGVEKRFSGTKLQFYFNSIFTSPEFLETIRQVTGEPVTAQSGRAFEIQPGSGFQWHGDSATHNRVVGFSLNLSPVPYEGGEFQIKALSEPEQISTVKTDYLDIHIFKVNNTMYTHRICTVTGEVPRLAYSGWFKKEKE